MKCQLRHLGCGPNFIGNISIPTDLSLSMVEQCRWQLRPGTWCPTSLDLSHSQFEWVSQSLSLERVRLSPSIWVERPSLRHLSESLCLTHWPLVAHSPRVVAAASSPARLLRILASPPSALPTLPTLLALPTLPTTPLLVNSWDARNLHLSFVTCACKSSANQSSIDPGHDLDDKAPSASLGKLCSISSEGSLVSSNRSWYARNLQRSRHWNECAKETCT